MTQAELDNLTTKLGKDKGYARAKFSKEQEELGGFVCPRANAYGGREGIIPPGIAAVRGLIPARMKKIAVADTAKTAIAAAEDGKTEAERYKAYYGEQANQARQAQPPAVEPKNQETQHQSEPALDASLSPALMLSALSAQTIKDILAGKIGTPEQRQVLLRLQEQVQAQAPETPGEALLPAQLPDQSGASLPTPGTRKPPRTRVKQAPTAARMFSVSAATPDDADTLDSFYDELKGTGYGTEETVENALGPVEKAGEAGPDAAGVPLPLVHRDSTAPRTGGVPAAVDSLELEKLRAQYASLRISYDTLVQGNRHLTDQIAALEKEKQTRDALIQTLDQERDALKAELTTAQQLKKTASAVGEQIRVVLSAPEEKIKLGGKGWECRIMGALHKSRTGDSLVLSVSDPSYAAELFAELVPGDVLLLTAAGRTACAYAGNCAKIYGESETADYLALFRFTDVRLLPEEGTAG